MPQVRDLRRTRPCEVVSRLTRAARRSQVRVCSFFLQTSSFRLQVAGCFSDLLIRLCQIVRRLTGRIPAGPATRWSGASRATDGKPHRKAESRPGRGPGRCCTHLLEMRFPAPSTRGAGAVGIWPENRRADKVELAGCQKASNLLYSALMFQPRIIGALVVLGIVYQSSWLFLVLSAVLLWNALVPTHNLFDAIYNHAVADPRGLPRLSAAPAPRRFAQSMARTLAVAIGAAAAAHEAPVVSFSAQPSS
jgi:hypothetical protein